MPAAITRLINAIDSPNTSANMLEEIVSTDPGLASRIMCVANSAISGFSTPVTSIGGAIMRLGMESVRSIALSFLVTAVATKDATSRCFNVERYALHSVYVGVMSRYLFSRLRRIAKFETDWTPEEIMAAGVMHDLAVPLLASVAKPEFEGVFQRATQEAVTFDVAFNRAHEVRLGELSAEACDSWGLPTIFAQTLRRFERPWSDPSNAQAALCIHQANHIADTHGHSLTLWGTQVELPEEFPPEMRIDLDEMEFVFDSVDRHVHELLGVPVKKAA